MITEQTLAKITAVEARPRPFASMNQGGWFRIQGFLGYVFSRQPIDALAVGLPKHDGTYLSTARQVHHRLLARFTAVHVFYRQWVCLLAGAVLAIPPLTNAQHYAVLYPDAAALVGAIVLLLLIAIVPWLLMFGVCSASLRNEVTAITRRCFLRDIADGAPADLSDPWRHGWLTADGRPLSAEISEADARFRLTRRLAWWWLPSIISLAIGIVCLCFGGLGIMVIGGCAILKFLFHRNPGAARPFELEAAEAVEASAFAEAGGDPWARTSEEARRRQIAEALRERAEPLVEIGTSTGILAARGDMFAPSRDLPVHLSRSDLRTHLLVFGGTGSGKTSGLLRPIAQQVSSWSSTGLLVLDGKGGLPRELGRTADLTLVDPATVKVSLVKGLEPDVLVSTLADILEPAESSRDPFWRNGAAALLRHSAVLAKQAGGKFWQLDVIGSMCSNEKLRQQVLDQISDEVVARDPMVGAVVEYYQYTWKEMEARVRSSIATTAQTWISTITSHRDLLAWARTSPDEDDIPLEEVLRGKRFGILLPAYRYAQAGAVVTALLKARIYAALKRRAEGWRQDDLPVVMLVDEAQEVATREDAAMLSIGRSLGLSVIAATQTREAIVEKLGEATAAKWLGVYGSVVTMQGRSPETDAFVAQKLGVTWAPRVLQAEGTAVRTALRTQCVSGAIAATHTQPSMVRFVTPERLAGRGSLGVWEGLRRIVAGHPATPRPTSALGASAVVQGAELATLLGEADTALAVLNRARAPWRDVIRLKPVHLEEQPSDAKPGV